MTHGDWSSFFSAEQCSSVLASLTSQVRCLSTSLSSTLTRLSCCFSLAKPVQDLSINTDNTALTLITNCCVSPTSQRWSQPTTSPKSVTIHSHITAHFLQSLQLIHDAAARIVLSVPKFILSHCSYTMRMAVHTENKAHTFRSWPRLLSMLSVLVQLSNYLSLCLQWPCCLLSPLWRNDFPTWVRWAWVITSSPSLLQNLYLSHISVFIYLPAYKLVLILNKPLTFVQSFFQDFGGFIYYQIWRPIQFQRKWSMLL